GLLMTRRVAMACHATRRSKRDISLAIRLERGIREIGRGRSAVHVRLFLEVGIGSEFRSGIRGLFLRAKEVARPLGTQQHVIFPDRAFEDALELLVHLLRVVRQRSDANDLALEWAVEFQSERWLRLPGPRRRLVHFAGRSIAPGIIKAIRRFQFPAVDFFFLGHIVDVLERRPYPLQAVLRLMHDVEAY